MKLAVFCVSLGMAVCASAWAGDGGLAGESPIEARLVSAADRFILGEPIWVRFEAQSHTATPLALTTSHATTAGGRSLDFDLRVENRDTGRPLDVPDTGPIVGSLLDSTPIAPHGTFAKDLFLPLWAEIRDPGRYRVTLARNLVLRTQGQDAARGERVVSTRTTCDFEVVRGDAEAMGKVIDRLGRDLIGASDPAVLDRAIDSLARIHDTRTLQWWEQAIASGHAHRMYEAAAALGTYREDRALDLLSRAALVRAADVQNREPGLVPEKAAGAVRWSAAQSLLRSPHPRARTVLVTLYADARPEVRLVVVDALADATGPESEELLRRMTKDPDERVRLRATEAIAQRAKR